jgi:cephalosporin hydroxylase
MHEYSVQERFGRAIADLQSGSIVSALDQLIALAKTNPNYPGLNFELANCYNRVGRHAEALLHAQEELKMQPDHQGAHQLEAFLKGALAPPEISTELAQTQPYSTSIPREFLLVLQKRLHNYSYKGVPMLKNPFDLAIYTQLLWNLKPASIVEIGSKSGGSALWFAHQVDVFGFDCRIFSIDIVKVEDVSHPRITFLKGDGNSLDSCSELDWRTLAHPWLVIDDANHEANTCLKISQFFDPLLRSGDYYVIEDGIISDLQPDTFPNACSGPHVAIRALLGMRPVRYQIDRRYCDLFGYNATWCTNGFLRRW